MHGCGPRLVVVALLLSLIMPIEPFTIRLGAPSGDCGYNSVANGLRFFALLAGTKPAELAIVDSTQTYPVEYVATTAEANCSSGSLVSSLQTLAESSQFLLAGCGFAAEQSLAADSLQRVLIHASPVADTIFDLGLPYVYGITSSPALYVGPVLKTMVLNDMLHIALIWQPDGGSDPYVATVCAGALSQLPGLLQLRPGMQLQNHTYTDADAATPGFFNRLVDDALAAGALALIGCGSLAAVEGLAAAATGKPLAAVFLVSGPMQQEFLQDTASGGGGLAYALSATQWSSAAQYGDSFFGSAAAYGRRFNEWAGMPPDVNAAGASAAALTLALALRTAFAGCNISSDVAQQGDATRLLFDPTALTCRPLEWVGEGLMSSGAAAASKYNTSAGAEVAVAAQSSILLAGFTASAAALAVAMRTTLFNATGYARVMHALLENRVETFYGPVEFNAHRRNVAKPPLIIQALPQAVTPAGAGTGGAAQPGAALSVEVVLPLEVATSLLVMPVPRLQHSQTSASLVLSPGSIVGISLAGLLLLVALVAVFQLYRRQQRRHRNLFGQVRPPGVSPQTTLCITDIESSTTLWESLPASVMEAAMEVHDATIRSLATLHDGYESANEGDSFVLAFHDPFEAVLFSVKAQQQLLLTNWPDALLRHEKAEVVFMTLVSDSSVLASACQMSSWCAQMLQVAHSKSIATHAQAGGLGLSLGLGSIAGGLNLNLSLRAHSLQKSLMGAARGIRRRLTSGNSFQQYSGGRIATSASLQELQRSIPFGLQAAAVISGADGTGGSSLSVAANENGSLAAAVVPPSSWIDGAAPTSLAELDAASALDDGPVTGQGNLGDLTEVTTAATAAAAVMAELGLPAVTNLPRVGGASTSPVSVGGGGSTDTGGQTGGRLLPAQLSSACGAGSAASGLPGLPGLAEGGKQPSLRPRGSHSYSNMLQLYTRFGGGGAAVAGGSATGLARLGPYSPGPSPLSTPAVQHHFYTSGAKLSKHPRNSSKRSVTLSDLTKHYRKPLTDTDLIAQHQRQEQQPSSNGFAPTAAAAGAAAAAAVTGSVSVTGQGAGGASVGLPSRSSTPGAVSGVDTASGRTSSPQVPLALGSANSAAGVHSGTWSGRALALLNFERSASALDGLAAAAAPGSAALAAAAASSAALGVIAAAGVRGSVSSAAGSVAQGVAEEVLLVGPGGGSGARLQLPSLELNVTNLPRRASTYGGGTAGGTGTSIIATANGGSLRVAPSWREGMLNFRGSAPGIDLSTLHSCTSSQQQIRLAALGQLGLSPEELASALATTAPSHENGQGSLKNNVMGRLVMSMFRRARPNDQPRFLAQRGLRVRMGLHSGLEDPHAISTNKASGRTQYGGSFLTVAKRTSDAANGGQICMTDETYRQIPSRSLLHRAWVLQMGHHQLGEYYALLEEEDYEYQVYQVVGYDVAVRLALLPPLRTSACLITGALSAPVGGLAIAFMYVHALQSLMSWNSEVTMEAVELFHRVAAYKCKDHDGYVSEGQEGLVLAAFRDPAQALLWALSTQQALINQPWDPELLEHELAEEVAVLVPATEVPAGAHIHPVGAAGGAPSPLPTQTLVSQELEDAGMGVAEAATAPAGGSGDPRAATGAGAGGTPGVGLGLSIGAAVADMYGMYDDDTVPQGMMRKVLMRGLRMRVGIDVGRLNESISPTSSVVVYRGKAMNRAARIGGLASASQVLCSAAVWRSACTSSAVDVPARINAVSLGRHTLRNVSEPIEVFHCRLRLPEQATPPSAVGAAPPSALGHTSGAGARSEKLVVPPFFNAPTELTLAAGSADSPSIGMGTTRDSRRQCRRDSELLNLLPPSATASVPLPSRLSAASLRQHNGVSRTPLPPLPPPPQQQWPPATLSSSQRYNCARVHPCVYGQHEGTASAPLPPLTYPVAAVEATADSGYGGRRPVAKDTADATGAAGLAANSCADGTAQHEGTSFSTPFVRTMTLGLWGGRKDSGLGDGDGALPGPAPASTATATLPIASATVTLDDADTVSTAVTAAAAAADTGADVSAASRTTSRSLLAAGAPEDCRGVFMTSPNRFPGTTGGSTGSGVDVDAPTRPTRAHARAGFVATPLTSVRFRDADSLATLGHCARSINTVVASSLLNSAVITASGEGDDGDGAHTARSQGSSSSGVRRGVPLRIERHSGSNIFLRDFEGPPAGRVGGGGSGPGLSDTAGMAKSTSGGTGVGGNSGAAVGAVLDSGGGGGGGAGKVFSSSVPKGVHYGGIVLKEGLMAMATTLMALGGNAGGGHPPVHPPAQGPAAVSPQQQCLPLLTGHKQRSQSGHPCESPSVPSRRSRRRSVLHTRAAAAVEVSGGPGLLSRTLVSSTSVNRSIRMGTPRGSSSQRRLSNSLLEVSAGAEGTVTGGEGRSPGDLRSSRSLWSSVHDQRLGPAATADGGGGGGDTTFSPTVPTAARYTSGTSLYVDAFDYLEAEAQRRGTVDRHLDLSRQYGDNDEYDVGDGMSGIGASNPRRAPIIPYAFLDGDSGPFMASRYHPPHLQSLNRERGMREETGERRDREGQFQRPSPNSHRGGVTSGGSGVDHVLDTFPTGAFAK